MNDLLMLSPLLLVAATGLLVLVMDLFRKPTQGEGGYLAWVTVLGLATAVLATFKLWPGNGAALVHPLLAGSLAVDGFTLFFWAVLPLLTGLAALLSTGFDRDNNLDHGEYYSFLAFALVGMMVMVAATELLLLFLALETMSLAVTVLVAMKRTSRAGTEAAFKVFINGAVASAFILYGMALLWGETGTLQLAAIGSALVAGGANALLYLGCALVLAGLAFKVAVVPFHMWTPDAYQGAPTPVSGFMAGVVKIAAFATLLRTLFVGMLPESFHAVPFSFVDLVVGVSVLTMTVGNLLAMHQQDAKRMLSYSSISHAGYLLMGVALVPGLGSGHASLRFVNPSVLFYLVAYGLSTMLAFGVLAFLGRGGSEDASYDRLAGLSHRRPGLAALLTLALLSLAGFPPTVGFFAKFALFRELMVVGRGKLTLLLVIAVVNALFSVYYYLRPVVAMYMQRGHEESREGRSASATFALVVLALLVLLAGILPGRLARLSEEAGKTVVYEHAGNIRTADHARLAPYAHPDKAPRE